MTLIFNTNVNGIPFLIGDSLISGNEAEELIELKLPNHIKGILDFFPPGSGFTPTKMRRKIVIVSKNMAVGVSGSRIHMTSFIKDLKDHFDPEADHNFNDLHGFIGGYADSNHGKIVLQNIHALIILRTPQQVYHYIAGEEPKESCSELDTKLFNRVVSIGSGQDSFAHEINQMDRSQLSMAGENGRDPFVIALTLNLQLISQLYKIDALTGRSILEYWGGAYDIIYWCDATGRFRHVEDYTMVSWMFNLDFPDTDILPYGVLKYSRKEDYSLIYVTENDELSLFAVAGLEQRAKREITIKREDIDFNSTLISNAVIVGREKELHNIYNFVNNYDEENFGLVFIDSDEENRFRINCRSDVMRTMKELILTKEASRTSA